jgi:hypothetical protein
VEKISDESLLFHKQQSQEWESLSADETVENDRQLVYDLTR